MIRKRPKPPSGRGREISTPSFAIVPADSRGARFNNSRIAVFCRARLRYFWGMISRRAVARCAVPGEAAACASLSSCHSAEFFSWAQSGPAEEKNAVRMMNGRSRRFFMNAGVDTLEVFTQNAGRGQPMMVLWRFTQCACPKKVNKQADFPRFFFVTFRGSTGALSCLRRDPFLGFLQQAVKSFTDRDSCGSHGRCPWHDHDRGKLWCVGEV